MQSQGTMLFNSSMIAGSNISTVVQWPGGKSAVVVSALAYTASGLQLQIQSPQSGGGIPPASGGGWINVASSFVSDQMFVFDAPKGNYRLVNQSTSSIIGVNAVMVTVQY